MRRLVLPWLVLVLNQIAFAQSTWYVDASGTPPGTGTPEDPYTSIQDAIDQPTTEAGDTILVAPGVYVENVTVPRELTLLSMGGPEVTTIDGGRSGSVVTFCASDFMCQGQVGQSVLDGFKITNGFNSTGAGVAVRSPSASIRNCVICGNSTPDYTGNGGGVLIDDAGSSSIIGCTIRDNFAEGDGGGIKVEGTGYTVVERCVIAGNTAFTGGGIQVLALQASHVLVVRSCTVFGNTSPNAGGIDSHGLVALEVTNTIVWNNSSPQLDEVDVVTYSDVEGGWDGPGNINADPMFWDAASDDYYLQPGSPCIDAGDPTVFGDPDGSVIDIGALPFDPTHGGCYPVTYCEAKLNSLGCLPWIGYVGEPSFGGPDNFVIWAQGIVSGQGGLLIWGAVPAATAFQGGTLCIQPPIIRTVAQVARGSVGTCEGVFRFHFSNAYAESFFLGPGSTGYAQYWYRDPGHPDGTGIGLTDGLCFQLCP